MISHTENNFYIVHSENTCNRTVGSFALKVNLSMFLSRCKETLTVKNEFTQEACVSYTWNLMRLQRVCWAQKTKAKNKKTQIMALSK